MLSIFEKFGEKTINDIVNKLLTLDANASGKLMKSLTYDLRVELNNIIVEIKALDYFKYIEIGRPKGKQPPLRSIKRWCKVRGIPISAAFPIAKKIGRFGIEPRPILQDVINKMDFKPFEGFLEKEVYEYLTKVKSRLEKKLDSK